MKKDTFSTIVHFLHWNAINDPQKPAFRFIDNKGDLQSQFTYAELDVYAFKAGIYLQQIRCKGERVLLLFPESIEFVAAFFGILYAQMIAIPVQHSFKEEDPERLKRVLRHCKPSIVLTTAEILANLQKNMPGLLDEKEIKIVIWQEITNSNSIFTDHRIPNDHNEAYIQYTSGSLGEPKAILITHDKLLINLTDIAAVSDHSHKSSTMSWLPFFHDMGLIAGILLSVYNGITCCLMTTSSFLTHPMSWLENLSRYKITHSIAPNSAFELCLKKYDHDSAHMDLSHVEYLANCGEQVIPETILDFQRQFGIFQLKNDVIKPCYGLAEATLKVTASNAASPIRYLWADEKELVSNRVRSTGPKLTGSRLLVGCGSCTIDSTIVIVDPHTKQICKDSEIGEIWVAGPSVADQYWNEDQDGETIFKVSLPGEKGDGRYLKTGDMGFIHDTQLYVTGRLKELLIINGQYHYPYEIERCAEKAQPAFRKGRTVLIRDSSNDDLILLVTMTGAALLGTAFTAQLFQPVIVTVLRELEIAINRISIVKHSDIEITSSGKIRRSAIQKKYAAGKIKVLHEYQP